MSRPRARPRASGWVKLGTSVAVIGAEIAESVLHPEVAESLAIADVAIPLIVGLILLTIIVRGSQETVDRVFRLLRWITNRPEPTVPSLPSSQPLAATAEPLSAHIRAGIGPDLPANQGPSLGNSLIARQAAMLREFDVSHKQGLSLNPPVN